MLRKRLPEKFSGSLSLTPHLLELIRKTILEKKFIKTTIDYLMEVMSILKPVR